MFQDGEKFSPFAGQVTELRFSEFRFSSLGESGDTQVVCLCIQVALEMS